MACGTRSAATSAVRSCTAQCIRLFSRRSCSGTSLNRVDGEHADIWVRHEEIDKQKIFAELPFHLRAEVAATLTKKLLKTSHVFSQLSDHDQKSITGLVWARSLAPGHEICRQGETADCMWILGDGEARANQTICLCTVVITCAHVRSSLHFHLAFAVCACTNPTSVLVYVAMLISVLICR